MAYSSLNYKLLVVQDDLYMHKILKEFLGIPFEAPASFDEEKGFAFIYGGDNNDSVTNGLNVAQN